MAFYLIFYLINVLLAALADKHYFSNKSISIIALSIIVLLHSVVLGLRDIGVGIDTTVYIEKYFYEAIYVNSFQELINSTHDYGYLLLSIICTWILPLPHSIMFGTEFVIILFFILGIWNYKKIFDVKIWIFITLFCLMYSMHTLNLMRQSCAIAILFYAFSLYLQDKKKIFIILLFIAHLFHTSAFFFIIVPVYYQISKLKNTKIKYIFIFTVLIVLVFGIYSYFSIMEVMGNYSLLSKYAENYGSNSEYVAEGFSTLGFRYTFTGLIIVYLLFYCKKRCIIEKNQFFFMMLIYISSSILVQYLSSVVQFAGRIGYYILVVWMLYCSMLMTKRELSILVKLFLLLNAFYEWYFDFGVGNGGEVIPYNSTLLGI